jgi:formylglycine-generating enzyme required for sulfatase activity
MPFPVGSNTANYNSLAIIPQNPYGLSGPVTTTVGTNGGPSAYGTYDQSGNVQEFVLTTNNLSFNGADLGIIGGSYLSNRVSNIGSLSFNNVAPFFHGPSTGFRLATRTNPYNLRDFVSVEDSGNSFHNKTLLGKVDYNFLINKYTVTVCDYLLFLNHIATIEDKYKLWNTYIYRYIIRQTNLSPSPSYYKYTYILNNQAIKNKPMAYITIFQAMRYCNWLHNRLKFGQQDATTTEDGAYQLFGTDTLTPSIFATPNALQRYYIPSVNEWYKAAFYKGGGTNAGYWDYATQTNAIPIPISNITKTASGPFRSEYFCLQFDNPPGPTSTPTPSTTPIPTNNSVNSFNSSTWNNINSNITTVGSNGSPSFYGTYDQNGNVWEWNDLDEITSKARGQSGGSAANKAIFSIKSINTMAKAPVGSKHAYLGFRVASNSNEYGYPNFVMVSSGNFSDINGLGSVSYNYYINKYTVTNCEYVEFLNAVASFINDKQQIFRHKGIFDPQMQSSGLGGITRIDIDNNHFAYTVKPNMGNKPVNFINWHSVARYCNWLHNGKPIGTLDENTTEDGAYKLNGLTASYAIPKIKTGAKYYIPTQNEWYKAAFHKGSGTSSLDSYWLYATQTDNDPTPIVADSNGNGPVPSLYSCSGVQVTPTATSIQVSPTPTSTPAPSPTPINQPAGNNTANFNGAAIWNTDVNITTVGTNGGASKYGTYDQTGNIWEWNDLSELTESISGRQQKGLRGGAFSTKLSYLSSSSRTLRHLIFNMNSSGFRIATKNNISNYTNLCFIGDPGNSNDSTGYGAVSYTYYIGKYTITNGEYVEFLNAVSKYDPYYLYNRYMTTTSSGGILRTGSYGNYSYSSKTNMGNKPVVYVSWLDAARYCNWLHWGKPSGESSYITETGAYNLNGLNSNNMIAIKNTNANYYIPTENEWYKAAYYKGNGLNSGYWLYATQSDSDPLSVSANSSGDGI